MTKTGCTGKLRYIHELESGPKLTRDMVLSLGVSGHSVSTMMLKMREMGLVESTRVPRARGNIWSHALVDNWQAIYDSIVAKRPSKKRAVQPPHDSTPELMYVAQLREGGLTGQRLTSAHQQKYPDTPSGRVHYLMSLARKRGLCR